jgi:hypothetical protein
MSLLSAKGPDVRASELPGEPVHLGDRALSLDRHQRAQLASATGDDARDEAVGDAFDEVPTEVAAHQRVRLGELDLTNPGQRVGDVEVAYGHHLRVERPSRPVMSARSRRMTAAVTGPPSFTPVYSSL